MTFSIDHSEFLSGEVQDQIGDIRDPQLRNREALLCLMESIVFQDLSSSGRVYSWVEKFLAKMIRPADNEISELSMVTKRCAQIM